MKRYIIQVVATVAFILPGAAHATLITFDDLAEGSILSTQYAAQGVTFTANAFSGAGSSTSFAAWATNTDMTVTATDVGGLGTPSLVSGNLLHSFSGWLDEDGDASFSINFASAISSFSAAFAGVSTGPDTRIFAYNGATLIGTVAGPATTTGQFVLSFDAPSITRVAIAPGSYFDWVGVDNINYTLAAAGAVPEPSSWAMMLAGFGMIGAAARRRSAVKATVTYA